jgi:hypothetical protein
MRFPLSVSLLSCALTVAASAQSVRKAVPVSEPTLFDVNRSPAPPRAFGAVPSTDTAVRKDPYDARAVAARTTALCRAGRSREAVDYLMDLKGQYLDFFPHQLALADAFAAASMFEDAAVAYRVVIQEAGYSEDQRRVAVERLRILGREQPLKSGEDATPGSGTAVPRRALAAPKNNGGIVSDANIPTNLSSRLKPGVEYGVRGSSQHEGTLWTSGVEISSGAFGDGDNVVFLRGIWDEIGLGHQRLITQDDADRYQTELAWRRLTRRGFYGEVSAGGGDEGGVVGAAVGHTGAAGSHWDLRFRSNDRATDTLLLMALGGTQDGVSFRYQRHFSERWVVDSTLGWRRVQIEGNEIAEGVDLNFRLAYTLLEETERRPVVTIGYFAEVLHMHRHRLPDSILCDIIRYARREPEPADVLIDDRINRHGLVFTASKQFGARWTGFVYGGVAYEFEDDRAEGLAGAGVTAYLDANTSLIISVDYSSSGNAANKGHDVVSGSVKVRTTF